jgi:hypothetical protein
MVKCGRRNMPSTCDSWNDGGKPQLVIWLCLALHFRISEAREFPLSPYMQWSLLEEIERILLQCYQRHFRYLRLFDTISDAICDMHSQQAIPVHLA